MGILPMWLGARQTLLSICRCAPFARRRLNYESGHGWFDGGPVSRPLGACCPAWFFAAPFLPAVWCWPARALLAGQLKVTRLTGEADAAAVYSEATWGNLHGLVRLTTPLLNLTFVTESGFRPAQRTEVDRALPAALRLAGLQTADVQEIADAVHDAFTAELTAQGIEIMAYELLAVNPGFQSLAGSAPPAGKEQPVPASSQTIADVSGGRRTATVIGHHCPWVDSFMSANYLSATSLTRELGATLPVVSFLVEFVEYSADRTLTYDWHEFLSAEQITDAPRLRARPLIYLAAGSAAFLLPAGPNYNRTSADRLHLLKFLGQHFPVFSV